MAPFRRVLQCLAAIGGRWAVGSSGAEISDRRCSDWHFRWSFPVPSVNCCHATSNWATPTALHILSNSLFTNNHIIRCWQHHPANGASVWGTCEQICTALWSPPPTAQQLSQGIILIYVQQDATLHSLFYLETALHVSGCTTTHYQGRKQLYLLHLVFVRPLLLPAASGR